MCQRRFLALVLKQSRTLIFYSDPWSGGTDILGRVISYCFADFEQSIIYLSNFKQIKNVTKNNVFIVTTTWLKIAVVFGYWMFP